MDMFKMIKEAAALRSRLAEMEKKMLNTVFEESADGVTIRMNAKTDPLAVTIAPELLGRGAHAVEQAVLAAMKKAIARSQAIMAGEAKTMTGGLKIPGLN